MMADAEKPISQGQRVSRLKEKDKKLKREKRLQRILYGTLGAAVAFNVLWLVALSTDYWTHLVLPDGGVILTSRQQGLRTTVIVTKLYIGLWRHCRVELANSTVDAAAASGSKSVPAVAVHINSSQTVYAEADSSEPRVRLRLYELCSQHSFYPSSEELKERGLDQGILDYRRAATGMAIIGFILSIISNSFSYYSIVRPRYVIRRLAGCMQLSTAASLAVSIEVFHGGLTYAQLNLPSVYPAETLYHVFGFSFGLAWVCFTVFLLAGVIFLINSRKDKTTDKDQPVNIGR